MINRAASAAVAAAAAAADGFRCFGDATDSPCCRRRRRLCLRRLRLCPAPFRRVAVEPPPPPSLSYSSFSASSSTATAAAAASQQQQQEQLQSPTAEFLTVLRQLGRRRQKAARDGHGRFFGLLSVVCLASSCYCCVARGRCRSSSRRCRPFWLPASAAASIVIGEGSFIHCQFLVANALKNEKTEI